MGQELFILPEHLNSPPVFSGARVTRSLVLCVCFVDRCLSVCIFSWPLCCLFFFDIRIMITPELFHFHHIFVYLQGVNINPVSLFALMCKMSYILKILRLLENN